MKYLLLLLLLLFCILGYSQNNGQFFENSAIRIKYIAYSDSCHYFQVTNKTECENKIKVDKQGNFQDYVVPANDSILICIPSSSYFVVVKFKVKREGGPFCSANPDNGWIELSSPGPALGINSLKILQCVRINNHTVRVVFQGLAPAKFYRIRISYDGINYKYVQFVTPKENQTIYSVIVNY